MRAAMPPSATIAAPLTYDDSSDARNSATLAISSGRPRRRAGIWRAQASIPPVASTAASSGGVSIGPGRMELTRIQGRGRDEPDHFFLQLPS